MIKTKPNITARRSGRPSREELARLELRILKIAEAFFFQDGYGAVSIEQISRSLQISKRTFYARFENKAELFQSVVQHIIQNLRPPDQSLHDLFSGNTLEEILERIAPVILHASLSPDALALHRLILAEATRFPELALIVNQHGSRQEAINRIAAVLQKFSTHDLQQKEQNTLFAAEQFLHMLTSAPQRRAMGLGAPMHQEELNQWAHDTVQLFIHGYQHNTSKT